jgi:hypothetical protein
MAILTSATASMVASSSGDGARVAFRDDPLGKIIGEA